MEGNEKVEICGVDLTDYLNELSKKMAKDADFKNQIQKSIERSLEDIRGIKLEFELMDPNAKLPSYAHEGDAGMDVFAAQDTDLRSGVPVLVHTGLRCKIPDGFELQVRPRSGLALKGVTVWNAPGTIDSKYRGEIGVILMYRNDHPEKQTADQTKEYYTVHKGDKIAQLVLAPVFKAWSVEVEKVDTDTDRGEGGFGSTGV